MTKPQQASGALSARQQAIALTASFMAASDGVEAQLRSHMRASLRVRWTRFRPGTDLQPRAKRSDPR